MEEDRKLGVSSKTELMSVIIDEFLHADINPAEKKYTS